MNTRIRLACALLAMSPLVPALAAAPTVPGPERLPADTWVLINWHGVEAATRVRSTNPVMKLWNDLRFAAAREQLVRGITQKVAREDGLDAALERANIADVLSLLENPVTIGISGDPLGPAPADGLGKVHFYAVLNRQGKQAEWDRLQQNQRPKPGAQVSTYTFRGVQVTRTITATPAAAPLRGAASGAAPPPEVRHSLEASVGNYELLSDHQPLMEALIARLQEAGPPAQSLLADAAYRRAREFRAEGSLLDAFVKIPDISRVPVPPTPQLDTVAALRELHLGRIHGLWFSAGMERERLLMRGALLGDFTPGGVLDLVGNNVTEFQTLPAAPPDGSYSALRLDLPALYATLLRAVRAGLPPDQAAAANMLLDGLVAVQTGMRTSDLLALFTGEIGAYSTGEDSLSDARSGVLMLPSTRADSVLGLIRTLAGGLVQAEEATSGATVLTVGAPPPQAAGGAEQSQPFHVAVLPGMVLVSPDKAQLQDALTRSAGNAGAGSLASDPTFRAARRELPAQLNGLNYLDMTRYRWDRQLASLREQFAASNRQTLQRAEALEKGDADTAPDSAGAARLREGVRTNEGLQQAIATLVPLLPRYLKTSTGGSWKADDGWFFESFVD